MNAVKILCAGVWAALAASPGWAQDDGDRPAFALAPDYQEFYGNIEFEATLFAEDARFPRQRDQGASIAVEPTLFAEWADGDLSATFTPFFRLDAADDARTHFDIREAKVDYRFDEYELTLGVDTVFWGKTEANHLVDIINQTDAVEDLDDEDNLGQPMVRVSRLTDVGEFSLFYLPYFRTRTFPGERGRLRSALPVNRSARNIEPDGGRWTPSFAARYAGVIENADIGLSAFHGVSRDPAFVPADFVNTPGGPAPTTLAPIYSRITQFGFDGQYTEGPTLYKAEAIYRTGQRDLTGRTRDYVGATGGVEYTLFGVFDNADLGLIAEYSWDSRGDDATNVFQSDVILGARLGLNDEADTSLLLTSALDHDNDVASFRLEAQTRVAEGWIAEVEGQFFINNEDDPLAADLQDDSFLRLKLTYYW